MDKTRSRARNQKHYSASTKKRCKKGCTGPWSDLTHHVLYSVMMQLSFVDFVALSGVCKSWRSLALSNRNEFMTSKPPMSIWVTDRPYKKECFLEDFEGKKLKIFLPRSVRTKRTCIGLTSGYLIMFSYKDNDYRLLNPITKQELHFPHIPPLASSILFRAVLVFSPSIDGWVFVTTHKYTKYIWFSTAGQGSWNVVKATYTILDLHFFKGKIYTLNSCSELREMRYFCEMSFNPEPKLTILETVNLPRSNSRLEFASSAQNLFVVEPISEEECKIHQLDFGEMKWVSHEKTSAEYAVFVSRCKSSAAVKPSSWADPWSRRLAKTPPSGNTRLFKKEFEEDMWYFPHDCFNVNCLEV